MTKLLSLYNTIVLTGMSTKYIVHAKLIVRSAKTYPVESFVHVLLRFEKWDKVNSIDYPLRVPRIAFGCPT